MSKVLDIEYCGGWGYGGSAMRLKQALAERFPGVEVNCHSASSRTRKIEVAWIIDGKKNIVWSKDREETNEEHAKIYKLLKES